MSWQTKTDRAKDKRRRIIESFDSIIADEWAALAGDIGPVSRHIDPPGHFTAHIFRELYA
eukprot:scaffold491130_cov25-Prasinocladus_malaysianus.AAC.1